MQSGLERFKQEFEVPAFSAAVEAYATDVIHAEAVRRANLPTMQEFRSDKETGAQHLPFGAPETKAPEPPNLIDDNGQIRFDTKMTEIERAEARDKDRDFRVTREVKKGGPIDAPYDEHRVTWVDHKEHGVGLIEDLRGGEIVAIHATTTGANHARIRGARHIASVLLDIAASKS